MTSPTIFFAELPDAFAFVPTPSRSQSSTHLFSAPAGPALKQKVTLKSKTVAPGPAAPKAKVAEPKTRGEVETEDAPRYKVLLIGDEEYVEEVRLHKGGLERGDSNTTYTQFYN